MAIITITYGDTTTGDLCMDDKKWTKANKKEKITWKLADSSGVNDIVNIAIKPDMPCRPVSTNIFLNPPKREGTSKIWSAVISDTALAGSEYNYYIKWRTTVGNEYTCDPKISIMPETPVSIQKVVLFILAIFTACAGAILFTKKGKKKK